MRYSSVPAALFGLYNWSRQCEVKALDYQIIFGIRSTLPKDTIQELIVQSRVLTKKFEGLCTPEQLTILEYRYGFKDLFEKPSCLDDISKLSCPDNFKIGELVAQKWRDNRLVIIHQVKRICGFQKSQAYEKIAKCKEHLEFLHLDFISDKCDLYCQIEKILLKNKLLKL